jgi:3-phosphoshikimate 1-carboxyvinyltransferase
LIDEIPVLAVLAARLPGRSQFHGVAELKVKESDRLARTCALLRACGRTVQVESDNLYIDGDPSRPLRAFAFDPMGDHRMAAAAVVASLVADGPCDIDHIDSLGVSYPALLDDLETLKQ